MSKQFLFNQIPGSLYIEALEYADNEKFSDMVTTFADLITGQRQKCLKKTFENY
jgi:hypothetical protein